MCLHALPSRLNSSNGRADNSVELRRGSATISQTTEEGWHMPDETECNIDADQAVDGARGPRYCPSDPA